MSGRGDWVLPAIVVVSVTLIGVLGLTAWMVVSDDAGTPEPAAQATVTASTTLRTTTVTATATAPVTVPTRPAQTPATTIPQTTAPSGAGGWYAQLGAFDDRSNADAAAAQHGGVVRPGYVVGSSSTWVAVIPAASESEAESICGGYGSGACLVRYSAE